MPENMSMEPEQPLVPESSQPVDTCMPAVQSCEQTPEEQSRRNPRCTYEQFKISRIKKDGTTDLLYTHQALSRNPGTQAFYIVSAPNFIDPGKSGSMAKIRCEVTGITGPCKGGGTSRHGENNKSWAFNRRILTEDLMVQAPTVGKLEFYAKSKEVGEQRGIRGALETFWIPRIRPEVYYVEANYCGSANRAVSISVYPDAQWEIKLAGTFTFEPEEDDESDDPEGVPRTGFSFSVKRTYGSDELEISTEYDKVLKNLARLVALVRKVAKFLEKSKKPRPVGVSHMQQTERMNSLERDFVAGKSGSTADETDQAIANQSDIREGFDIEWPEVDLTIKFGWEEAEAIANSAPAEYKYAIEGNLKLFKLTFGIELLGPLLNTIPGAGPVLSRLQKLGKESGLLKIVLIASASAEVKGTIDFKGVYGSDASVNIGGNLKFEFQVKAELSTRIDAEGPFGWSVEFAAGMEGSATTGFTFEATRELWKSASSGLEGGFKIKFEGITIRGVAYYNYGVSHEENGDGREESGSPSAAAQPAAPNAETPATRSRGVGRRNARNYSHVLMQPRDLLTKKFNFSEK